jgi:hypothetical protein
LVRVDAEVVIADIEFAVVVAVRVRASEETTPTSRLFAGYQRRSTRCLEEWSKNTNYLDAQLSPERDLRVIGNLSLEGWIYLQAMLAPLRPP